MDAIEVLKDRLGFTFPSTKDHAPLSGIDLYRSLDASQVLLKVIIVLS